MRTQTLPRGSALDRALFAEILSGLRKPQKQLPCKLFYDEAGAELFERICTLPEYYPTRTELGILQAAGREMAEWIGPRARIIEFGSGSGDKTRVLLKHLVDVTEYVPIDISEAQLLEFSAELHQDLPELCVRPLCADYTRHLELPVAEEPFERTIVFFPGSTIGNFEPAEAQDFLRHARVACGSGGGLLIGVDLRKDRSTLERAYNDAAGVTAAFNLNMLTHINHICDGNFDVSSFEHRALYDEVHGRIEMHLVSAAQQTVTINGVSGPERIPFHAGEHIITEYSYKYDVPGFQGLAASAGFTLQSVWTDPQQLFSVHAYNAR